jgi:prepilin-type N-terminal cleavage/methylation domain-containing protein
MFRCKTTSGFTLIELLIVMLIMSVSLSVVLPITIDQVEAARERSERQLTQVFFQKALQQTFFGSQRVQLKFVGRQVSFGEGLQKQHILFEHISFQEMAVELSSIGVESQTKIPAAINGVAWTLELTKDEASWVNAD